MFINFFFLTHDCLGSWYFYCFCFKGFNALFYSFVVSNYLIHVPLIKIILLSLPFHNFDLPFVFSPVLFSGFVYLPHINFVMCDYVLVDFDGSDAQKHMGILLTFDLRFIPINN